MSSESDKNRNKEKSSVSVSALPKMGRLNVARIMERFRPRRHLGGKSTATKETSYCLLGPSGLSWAFSVSVKNQHRFLQELKDLVGKYATNEQQRVAVNEAMAFAGFSREIASLLRGIERHGLSAPRFMFNENAPSIELSQQEQMLVKVFETSEWVTSRQICERGGFSKSNPSAQPNRWKNAGRLFALKRGNCDVFPLYALDDHLRPLPAIKDVLDIFHDKKSELKTAYWFASFNSWLRDKRPMDLIISDPAAVIKAAKAEVAPIEHG